MMTRALAYLRTSSAANIEGASAYRQNGAIMTYATRAGLDVVACFWDGGVSGVDPIETRAGFAALLDLAERDDIKMVLVESADRFARSMIACELGVLVLIQRGIKLFTTSGQELTDATDPSKVMLRQIAAAFAEYEKSRLVLKLRAARERKRTATGRCEGRKPTLPQAVADAAREAAGPGKSLRAISAILAAQGHVTASGRPHSTTTIRRLLKRARTRTRGAGRSATRA